MVKDFQREFSSKPSHIAGRQITVRLNGHGFYASIVDESDPNELQYLNIYVIDDDFMHKLAGALLEYLVEKEKENGGE